jgi:hypothetical protein
MAKAYISALWPNTHGGDASVGRQDPTSDHGKGKALDIFPGTRLGQRAAGDSLSEGWSIANWLGANPQKFGTKYLIWQGKINSGKGWAPYTRYGPDPGTTRGHFDHVHASFLHGGGQVKIPGLDVGGKVRFDNTLANLHRDETVLTAPLTAKLEAGINKLDSGTGAVYNLNLHITEPGASADEIVQKAMTALRAKETAVGRSRKVGR